MIMLLTEGTDHRCGAGLRTESGDREFGVDSVDRSGVVLRTHLIGSFLTSPFGRRRRPYLLPAEAAEVLQSTDT